MAKNDKLPDSDHIVRYVPWGRLRKDADDNVVGILSHAFKVEEKDDGGLSVNWLELIEGDLQTQLRESARLIQETQQSKSIGKKARLARLNVGATISIAAKLGSKIRILHDPIDGNPPHSEIRQLSPDDEMLLDALAEEAVLDHHQCGPLLADQSIDSGCLDKF